MTYFNVIDISYADVSDGVYDLAIFSCGYEERSVYFAGLNAAKFKKIVVLGFADSVDNPTYRSNEDFYISRLGVKPDVINYLDSSAIFNIMARELKTLSSVGLNSIKILVDYSSMPRIWYSEIINFIKCSVGIGDVLIDFVYSIGEHEGANVSSQLTDPIVLPGCEAVSAYNRETIGIFSLGFGEGGPICLHHKIEPDKTYALIARPGALEDYTEKTLKNNDFFIRNFVDGVVHAPLASVQISYDTIREIFYPYRESAVIVVVPFGPKPHALASILAAINYPEVTCLYSSQGGTGCPVKPTTEFVICRVENLPTSPFLNP